MPDPSSDIPAGAGANSEAAALDERLGGLAQEFEALRHERDELLAELERRRGQGSSVRSLQQELDETLAEHARLQGRLSASKELEEVVRLRTEERDAAREEARRLREKAALLCEKLEERTRKLGQAPARPHETAAAEQDHLRSELDAAHARIGALEEELRKSYRQLAIRTAEMDALRHTAVSQVAAANVHAGELDRRVAQLEAALEITRATGKAIGTDAGRIGGDLTRAATALRMLSEHQDAMIPGGREAGAENDAAPGLFDLESFSTAPPDFDASRPFGKPVHDPKLRDVIEEAFNPRPPQDSGTQGIS